METKSIFSVNTNQTSSKFRGSEDKSVNLLHDFYYRMFPLHEKECPYLCKILFLHLLLRESFLILTEDRVDVKDVWIEISKSLELKKPEIYVADEKMDIL